MPKIPGLLKRLLDSTPGLTQEQIAILNSITAVPPPPPSQLPLGAQSALSQAYQGYTTATTITTAGNTAMPVYYPNQSGLGGGMTYPYPNPAQPSYIMPTPQGQIMFFITPIQNGFLIGTEGALTEKCKYCKDYSEVAESIVALLALNKLTEK